MATRVAEIMVIKEKNNKPKPGRRHRAGFNNPAWIEGLGNAIVALCG